MNNTLSQTLLNPPNPTILVAPMLSAHCGAAQLVRMCNKPLLLEDNGIKAREKAVSTEAQPSGFQKETGKKRKDQL